MCCTVFPGGVLLGKRLEGWLPNHVASSLNTDKGSGGVDRLQEAVLVSFVVVTNRQQEGGCYEPRFQGYLLAADSRQEIKTICDKALFLLSTDGSFQIGGSKL